jgi:quinol monooxygenase YgiN
MSRFGLFGKFTAQPGQRDALLALLVEAAKGVSDAPGCEIWIVSTSPDDPDGIWVSEVWRSEEDHAASLKGDETRALIERAMPLIKGMEHVKLAPVAGKGLAAESS